MRDNYRGPAGPTAGERLARTAATVVGAVFLLVGVLGFIPGITTPYDGLKIAGHQSHAELLGIFQVSALHNVIHLLFGVAGLAAARRGTSAVSYLIGGGAVYAVVWIYGLVVKPGSQANFVPLNAADNWLHLLLAIGMIATGVLLQRRLRGGAGSRSPL